MPTPKPTPKPAADAGSSPSPSASAEPGDDNVSPSASEDSPADSVTVEIKNYAFSPDSITVKVGGKVEFINRDDVAHSAVADDKSFDTGLIDKDKSATVTFDKAGTYTFHCGPHPFMTATVVVESP
ncbi:cupredoxin domain-containing protein [Cohnella zeiphila]|uniref:Cupredoxin family copper-binding protein n=1 Tax=Cohnella zeiphila TaxID=2761120 RepID=A0A7X0VTQ3_9BACL|nr:cupredoxin family copper-binding protein [Cohnella zeiphila]MBB6730191.1 cupredoxin family copper-binding protein [Cohnella zeiphila]